MYSSRFAADPVRSRIYATNPEADVVYVFNTSPPQLIRTLPVGQQPVGLAISADNSKLFVANMGTPGQSDYVISVIDLKSLTNLPSLHVSWPPLDLEEGLDNKLFVSSSSSIPYKIGDTYHTAQAFQVDSLTGEFQNYVGADQLFAPSLLEISPDRQTLYAGTMTFGNESLLKFDVSMPQSTVLQKLQPFGSGPGQITLSHNGNFICFSVGLDIPDVFGPPPVALFTSDLSVKGTLAYDGYLPLPCQIALSPDDSVAYQLDEETDVAVGIDPQPETGVLIHLRNTTAFRLLDDLVVASDNSAAFPTVMTTDHTGSYLFVGGTVNTLVYDVSPRIETIGQMNGLVGAPFSYQTQATFDSTTASATGLPPGLTISNAGLISGTPTTEGDFVASVTLAGGSVQATQSFSFHIDGTRLLNVSTRAFLLPDNETLIGGFIIDGPVPKQVVVRILGPSLAAEGVVAPLPDPSFYLYNSSGLEIAYNNNWQDLGYDDLNALEATGLTPPNPLESAISLTLDPGAYTAVVQNGSGTALFEVYDVDENSLSRLANLSSRALVMPAFPEIAGIIVTGPDADNVLIRGLGPSLASEGISNPLPDPSLELYNAQGDLILSNNNWKDTQEAAISDTGIAPTNDLEAAILTPLSAGAYTAVLQGATAASGVSLVEAYHIP